MATDSLPAEKRCAYCSLEILPDERWVNSHKGFVHSDDRATCVRRLSNALACAADQRLTLDARVKELEQLDKEWMASDTGKLIRELDDVKAELEECRRSHEPKVYAAPIVQVIIGPDYCIAGHKIYAPGLPPGVYDLYLEADLTHWDRQYSETLPTRTAQTELDSDSKRVLYGNERELRRKTNETNDAIHHHQNCYCKFSADGTVLETCEHCNASNTGGDR